MYCYYAALKKDEAPGTDWDSPHGGYRKREVRGLLKAGPKNNKGPGRILKSVIFLRSDRLKSVIAGTVCFQSAKFALCILLCSHSVLACTVLPPFVLYAPRRLSLPRLGWNKPRRENRHIYAPYVRNSSKGAPVQIREGAGACSGFR